MKKILYIFAILAIALACSKEDAGGDGTITISSGGELIFSGEQVRSLQISFNASGKWNASSSEQWCRLSSTGGEAGSAVLSVSVEKNETGNDRNATVTISTAKSSATIKVKQNMIYVMDFAETDYLLPCTGDTIAVSFSTNMSYEYSIPDEASWIKPVVKSRAIENHTHYFYVESNSTYDNRNAKIAFINKANRDKKEISITQLQKDAIIPADSSYSIGAESQIFEFAISSNVDYDISTSAEWIQCIQTETKALTNKNIKFEVAENDTFDKRNATITLKSEKIVQEIEITQNTWPSKMVLTIIHNEKEFFSPSFTGRELGGTILWGDGSSEKYKHESVHKYDSSRETTTVYELHGNEIYTFEIPVVNSIKSFTIVSSKEE